MYISWDIEGDRQISRRLEGMATKMTDFRKPLERSARYLKGVFSGPVFTTKGLIINEQWKRLSPATVARKARSGFPSDPLIATGRMKASFRTLVSPQQAVIYNDTPYFKYHQSNKPRSKIPRRVMMKMAELQKQQVIKYFQLYLRESMGLR